MVCPVAPGQHSDATVHTCPIALLQQTLPYPSALGVHIPWQHLLLSVQNSPFGRQHLPDGQDDLQHSAAPEHVSPDGLQSG
jgi:hypothetical protein